jgi:hypothetical protein
MNICILDIHKQYIKNTATSCVFFIRKTLRIGSNYYFLCSYLS